MYTKAYWLMLIVSLLLCTVAAAELQVADAVITTGIENQMPIDEVQVHPADYGKLFCFTRILGAEKETQVTHVWYYQESELARVELPVGSADWRTYSSKRFLPQWAGQWQVVVLDEAGRQLASVPFVLE